MSSFSVSAVLESASGVMPIPKRVIPWLRVVPFTLFGIIFLSASFYLVVCFVTFDLFGSLQSPLFGWLRSGATFVHYSYFPLLAAGLISVTGKRGSSARRFAGFVVCIQIPLAFWMYFRGGIQSPFGWTLVYGPTLQLPSGRMDTYTDALACLVPVIWISIACIMTAFPAPDTRRLSSATRFGSFLLAGLVTSLLYTASARLRITTAGQQSSWKLELFSILAHLAIFAAIFLALEWTRIVANRFRNPSQVQFVMRHALTAGLLALLLRKIIFALLGFNDRRADFYCIVFSVATVIFAAAWKLKVKEVWANPEPEPAAGKTSTWLVRALLFAAILGFFYLVAMRFVAVDWEHIVSSSMALLLWVLVLRFCLQFRPRAIHFPLGVLVFLSALAIAGCIGIRIGIEQEKLGALLEQYGNYNPSVFAIQQIFKAGVRDDQYASWYGFLQAHANMRVHTEVPILGPEVVPVSTGHRKPNIFIFVIDALRRDYVSVYNPKVQFTPSLEQFAKESVVFRNAYSQYAGTSLADAAIWSGQQQIHQIFPAPVSRLNRLEQMLEADGYTSYVAGNPYIAMLLKGHRDFIPLSDNLQGEEQQEFAAVIRRLEQELLTRKDPECPIFAFAQPLNVHTLALAWHQRVIRVTSHPGFDDAYASSVEDVDRVLGEFIEFLKRQGLYDNSVVVITADHGESLGEMGRESHVSNLTPELIQIPLMVHLPKNGKMQLVARQEDTVSLHDITPTLFYLAGHRPVEGPEELMGHSLFVPESAKDKDTTRVRGHDLLLMSGYLPVFGILSEDRKSLFMVDATLRRSYFYNLERDPKALKNEINLALRDRYETIIRQHLRNVDRFYNVSANFQ